MATTPSARAASRAAMRGARELFRDGDRSPEKIAAAVEFLRAVKNRIDARDEREAARRDPYVRAALEDALARFGQPRSWRGSSSPMTLAAARSSYSPTVGATD
jgi:hypothetical protein